MKPEIITLEAFTDNYIYLLQDGHGKIIVVDPGDADAICDFLENNQLNVHYVLVTHHHSDHIAAIGTLHAEHHCEVIAPAKEAQRIPDAKHLVKDTDKITLNKFEITAIETPGHTKGHICYHIPQLNILFSGDALFAFGCGRLMEGTAAQLCHSLSKLCELPDETMVYCGHEYTMKNIEFTREFSKQIGFTLPDLFEQRAEKMQQLRDAGQHTMPFNLGEEKLTNLFMQADNPELINLLEAHGEIEAFTKIRTARNHF